jgi:thiamine pyrophosphate-dependent acetolactate synthase large subunit-like protein
MSNSHTRSEQQTSRIGGHILADALAINAVDTVFCVPGESYLPLLDGLYEHRERVERTEDFAAAFERALGAGKPALIELVLDPEVLTPTQTIAGLRAANL